MKPKPFDLVDAHKFTYEEKVTTPEGKIKDDIKKVLKEQQVYYFMPVQMGYGPSGLDFHCIVLSKINVPFPFFIEAKKPGHVPTPRQNDLRTKLREEFRCKVWVINKAIDVKALEVWLQTIRGA